MTTFKEAFAAARKAGKEKFTYDGKVYTTEVADETKFVDVTNTVKPTPVPSNLPKLKFNKWPKQSELKSKFGAPSYSGKFKKDNMAEYTLPYTMWMDDIKITKVWMNKICGESLIRVLTYLWEFYGRDYEKIKSLGLHIFSGTWNIRNMRGGNAISTHAWGLAIDISAPYNALGKKPGYNKLSFTENSEIVKAFEAEGAVWGGRWEKRPDPMHFQFCIVG